MSTQMKMNQDTGGAPQNEIAIAVNPADPSNIVGGANDYRSGGGTGFYSSLTNGASWQDGLLPMPPGVDTGGDPVIAFNGDGTKVFFVHLGFETTGLLGGCDAQSGVYLTSSTDGGQTWATSASLAPNGATVFNDKPWLAVDTTTGNPGESGNVYVTYTKFTYGTTTDCQADAATGTSPVKLRRSTDGGATWDAEVDVSGSFAASQGSVPAIAPDGTVYVAFESFTGCTDCIVVAKSTDGGQTFTRTKVADINGVEEISAGPGQTFRGDSFPSLEVDSAGTVYVVWNEPRGGASTNDVWMSTSVGGTTWSAPKRVNEIATNDQFFPSIVIDDGDVIWVSYSDRREDPSNIVYRQYLAHSHDGGATFTDTPVASVASDPRTVSFDGNLFVGDYNDIDAIGDGTGVWMGWCDTRNSAPGDGEQDAFAARVDASGIPTTVTAAIAPSIGVWGTTFTLSGTLSKAGDPLGGKPLGIQQRPVGAQSWSPLTTTTTATDGTYAVSLGKPSKTTEYRAVFAASEGLLGSNSPPRAAQVRVGIPANVADSTLVRGQTAVFTGQVLPGHPGKKVMLQQLTNSGWVTIQTVTLDSASRFRATARLTVAGFRLYRIAFATQDGDHVWNLSRNLGVRWS